MILKLTNNKNTYSFEVEDLNNGEKLFYHFEIPTADMEDGNYKMVLLDGDEIVTEEQVCIGAYNPQAIQYSRGENVYINAPFEANLEDVKEVEITAIETTVLPSEGYDGIKAVDVNAQPIYDEGYNVGNADGIEVGKAEQKTLLEPITITENGTYENENGYSTIEVNVSDTNGSYDEGYTDGYAEGEAKGAENAGEIVAASAIDLVATKLGTYYTKYSDNIVNTNPITGVYPDGENFYNLASIKNNIYNTKIIPNENTKLEFWFKPDGSDYGGGLSIIILTNNASVYDSNFGVYQNTAGNQSYEGKIGSDRINFNLINGVLYHIVLSVADGLIVNGEQIGTFNSTSTFDVPLYINGLSNDIQGSADGEFGMIKITQDGIANVIIPTEDGLKNITTDELLEVVYNEGIYNYINNDSIVLDNLIKSVDVQPKIDVGRYGIKFSQSSFSSVPEWADFSNTIDMSYMFENCAYLSIIPLLDTSNAINMYYMFASCGNLENAPHMDTSNVSNMERMFYYCSKLTTLPELDVSKLTNIEGYFRSGGDNLTNVGGWKNLKIDWNDNYGLARCSKLTYQSCINILNGLWDFRGNGDAITTKTLKVHSNFITTVGDEISIGTNKGWIITA